MAVSTFHPSRVRMVNTVQVERARRRWTQQYLAERAGGARDLVSRLERDPDYRPAIRTLELIAAAFGLPLHEVFTWQDED